MSHEPLTVRFACSCAHHTRTRRTGSWLMAHGQSLAMPSSHERQVTILALVTGLPSLVVALVLLWTGDFAARTQWTLTIALAVFSLVCALAHARAGHSSVADALEHARRDSRAGLFAARPPVESGGRARPRDARIQFADERTARAAARRARSHGAAAARDGGDRRRGARLRRRRRAATRQRRRRAAARASLPNACSAGAPRNSGSPPAWRATHRDWSSCIWAATPAAGSCVAARSARADVRTSSCCSPT